MARSIEQLAASAQQGDHAALEQLYSRFQPLIRSLIARYQRLQVADDLEGEVYLAFVRLIRHYDPARGVHLPYYITRMLRAAVYTYVRRECLTRDREIPGSQRSDSVDVLESVPSRTPDAYEGVVSAVALADMLRHLTPQQAYVFVHRGLHEREYHDIAKSLAISPGAARVHFHAARRRLEQHWRAALCQGA